MNKICILTSFCLLFILPVFSLPQDDPGDTSVIIRKTDQWVKAFPLSSETTVFCHIYGEGVFRVEMKYDEKSVRRTIEIEAKGWKSFTREIGPGTVSILIKQIEKPEYPNPLFIGAVVTANPDFIPAVEDLLAPLYVRFTNSGEVENRIFVSVACQNPSRYYFSPGYVTVDGFAQSGSVPSQFSTKAINISRLIYGRTVLGFKFSSEKKISCVVEFFRDRECTIPVRSISLFYDAPFTEYFVIHISSDGNVKIVTTEEIIASARMSLLPEDLKRNVPQKIEISLPISDSDEKLENFRAELALARAIGANGVSVNLGRLEHERARLGFQYVWHADYFPIYDNWDWNTASLKAEMYVRKSYERLPKGLKGTVMLADEPAFIPLAKDDKINTRFLSWVKENKLSPQDLGVLDFSKVNVLDPSISNNKRLSYYFYKFQMEQQINYWNSFAALYTKSNPGMRTAVNWQADLYYSGANFIDLWELYRKPGLEIVWAEDWYGYMPQGSGVIAWYADLMRSQAKYRNLPTGTYPIAYAYSPSVIALNYYERLMRGCTAFHPYSYSLRANDSPWVDNPVATRNIATCHRDIAEVEDFIIAGKVRSANVCIIYPNSCFLFDKSAYKRALAVYLALLHSGIPVDILSEQDIIDGYGSIYSVFYLIGGCVRKEVLLALGKLAEEGAVLCVMSPRLNDQFDEPIPNAAQIFGLEEVKEITNVDCGRFAYEFQHIAPIETVVYDNKEIQLFCQKSSLTPSKTSKVLARFSDGNPAIVYTRKGKGAVYFFGFNPGLSYLHADYGKNSGLSTALVARDAERALSTLPVSGIIQPVSIDTKMVSARIIDSKDGMLVGITDYGFGKIGRREKNLNPSKIDFETMEPYIITVTILCRNKPDAVFGVRNKILNWKYISGNLIVEVPLRGVEMIILNGKNL